MGGTVVTWSDDEFMATSADPELLWKRLQLGEFCRLQPMGEEMGALPQLS